jgi:hypothetical protein
MHKRGIGNIFWLSGGITINNYSKHKDIMQAFFTKFALLRTHYNKSRGAHDSIFG